MNKCIFMGNLTRDFEYRVSQGSNTPVARGAMALNGGKDKDGKDKPATFVNLVAFNTTADMMDKYGKKGKKLLVECHVVNGSYEKDGHKFNTTEYVIDRFEFAGSKETSAEKPDKDEFIPIPDINDEELPFM